MNGENGHAGTIDTNLRCNRDLYERLMREGERRALGKRKVIDAAFREFLERHEVEEIP